MISPLITSVVHIPIPQVKLVTAAENDLLMVDHIGATVQIQDYTVTHSFIVVNTLITPAILGIDFLRQHSIKIDYATTPIKLCFTWCRQQDTRPVSQISYRSREYPVDQTLCSYITFINH